MSDKPNNFPREGQHNTITRDALNKLETLRAKPNKQLDYTIGGTRETIIHSNVDADKNYALNTGHRRLNELSAKVQTDHVFSANKGRARAQFNTTNDDKPTYAQMQRITQIRNRLTSATDRLKTARNKTLVRGTARGDFDRSR